MCKHLVSDSHHISNPRHLLTLPHPKSYPFYSWEPHRVQNGKNGKILGILLGKLDIANSNLQKKKLGIGADRRGLSLSWSKWMIESCLLQRHGISFCLPRLPSFFPDNLPITWVINNSPAPMVRPSICSTGFLFFRSSKTPNS